ncbi:acetyl-CoA carboxylase biotin carboxyl carrier protein subunit [Thalassobacillus sp. C254]|uniref:acetyl-CoA carboxylase biotin carboxyl carrier protein subunit n=1 Tax=Thalassobacillus sp. C254 TaxID=1225341 RepID=UPI0006D0B816|nr:acetyl-CoA carboxylase biotin carboxyl carrier protein subunit [Thalassobacillus sp. C254]
MSKISANMAGNIWKILVKEGDIVNAGEDIMILESMKMEIPVTAEQGGSVKTILKQEGDFVNEGEDLLIFD